MIYLTKQDLNQATILQESFTENNIYYKLAEFMLGEHALPDYIIDIEDDIKQTHLNERYETFYVPDNEGEGLLTTTLNCTKLQVKKMLADPKRASIALRALRNKYEELSWQEQRARAEERGFFATVLYTIKKAIYWLVNKFRDLKDDAMDLFKGRRENSSRTKRDYLFLRDMTDDYLAKNTYWYNNSEY